MNNYFSSSKVFEIDLHDFFWKLLMQWKAILLICFAMALLIPGAKYLKDSKDYRDALTENEIAMKEASLSVEERISNVLNKLPADEAAAVQFVLQQQDLIENQQDYINNSILFNMDPTSMRNLSIKYYLQNKSDSDMQAFIDAYSTCVRRTKEVSILRNVISPDAPLQYIYELVSSNGGDIADSNVTETIFTINIILPDDVEADAVVKATDDIIKDIHERLTSLMGDHSIKRVNTEDYRTYSTVVADRRSSVSLAVNNLYNSINAAKGRFTEEQLAALETATAIKKETASDSSSTDTIAAEAGVKAPFFNKKYSVLGFVLGAFLYAAIYLLLVIRNKMLSSVAVAQDFTGARLLGEMYVFGEHKGLNKLFSSRTIAKKRYKGKLDIDVQTEAAASTIDAVCSHHNTDHIALLMSEIPEDMGSVIDMITKKCRSNGHSINLDVIDTDKMEEKSLSSISNAIYAVCSKSKTDTISKLMELCRDYDIAPLGTLYLEEL